MWVRGQVGANRGRGVLKALPVRVRSMNDFWDLLSKIRCKSISSI